MCVWLEYSLAVTYVNINKCFANWNWIEIWICKVISRRINFHKIGPATYQSIQLWILLAHLQLFSKTLRQLFKMLASTFEILFIILLWNQKTIDDFGLVVWFIEISLLLFNVVFKFPPTQSLIFANKFTKNSQIFVNIHKKIIFLN